MGVCGPLFIYIFVLLLLLFFFSFSFSSFLPFFFLFSSFLPFCFLFVLKMFEVCVWGDLSFYIFVLCR